MIAPDQPNQPKDKTSRLRRVPAWLRVPGLAVLLVAGWIAWDAWQIARERAAAPVLSVAADGSVRFNGQVLVTGTDGLPPALLEAAEGAPPVEVPPRNTYGQVARRWHYPRLGLQVQIYRDVRMGRLRYQSRLFREGVGGPPGCTLEYDGRVRWLGRPALLDVLTQAVSRPGQKSEEEEYRKASDISRVQKSVYSTVYLSFGRHRPLRKLGLDLFSRQVLAYVALVLPEVTGPTPQERGVGTPEERW